MPAAADVVVATVRVEELPEVTDVGLTVAVTPLGAPETDRLMVCAVPFVVAVAIVLVPPVPATNDNDVGLAEMLKSLGALFTTVRATVVLCDPLLADPVIVTVNVPAAAEVLAVNVRVDVPPELMGLGLNDAVTPEGRPDAFKVTCSAIPAVIAVETVT